MKNPIESPLKYTRLLEYTRRDWRWPSTRTFDGHGRTRLLPSEITWNSVLGVCEKSLAWEWGLAVQDCAAKAMDGRNWVILMENLLVMVNLAVNHAHSQW